MHCGICEIDLFKKMRLFACRKYVVAVLKTKQIGSWFCEHILYIYKSLTHWGIVTHKCDGNLTIIGSDNAWSALSLYMNQCWNISDVTFKNKLQWNFNRNSDSFIKENAFEKVVCEIAAILSQPQCVNQYCKCTQVSLWHNVIHLQYCTNQWQI